MDTIAKILKAASLLLASRESDMLDIFPKFSREIELFIEEDPSGNKKYLEWSCMMLATGQTLEENIVDVVNLFHRFKENLKEKDINKYKDFNELRDILFAMERNKLTKKKGYKPIPKIFSRELRLYLEKAKNYKFPF